MHCGVIHNMADALIEACDIMALHEIYIMLNFTCLTLKYIYI